MKNILTGRDVAILNALEIFDSGSLMADLRRRVDMRTESQPGGCSEALLAYLRDEIGPTLQSIGFNYRVLENPAAMHAPFLIAERHESSDYLTVLTYGHGDVIMGKAEQWRSGLTPWDVIVEGDRWYGRGTADNKGQHSINFAALAAVLKASNDQLGFNLKIIFEMGEEIGSPGLKQICETEKRALAADVFLASDGPRVSSARPTVFLGSRGYVVFELLVDLRKGAHHSGNWGGVLRNPAVVLSHAIASLVERDGRIAVQALKAPQIPRAVRAALANIQLEGDSQAPEIDPDWGELTLTPIERIVANNTLEVLAIKCGQADAPVNAIQPIAKAVMQLRFVVGTDWQRLVAHVEQHLVDAGIGSVQVKVLSTASATRLALDNPWVRWSLDSVQRTTKKVPALLPNLGGTVPNDVFAETLGLPTLWIPHSYPGCNQHAPNEHLLGSLAREAIAVMAGVWWDLGEKITYRRQRGAY